MTKIKTNQLTKILSSIALGAFLLTSIQTQAQTRYLDEVFDNIKETKNVIFSTAVPIPKKGGGLHEGLTGLRLNVREDQLEERNLYMNIFKPEGDNIGNRPVIIFCHGGAFVLGGRNQFDIKDMAQKFAKMGYVTATIDYRKGINIWSKTSAIRTVYRSIQDGRSAVRFFRADAAGNNDYRINPRKVYIAGHSAGAFIALHNGYLDKESERPEATKATTFEFKNAFGVTNSYPIEDQGCLDCVGDNQEFNGKANAVIAMAGAMGCLEHIEGADDVPTLLMHSDDDNIINYNEGLPFENFSALFPNYTIPVAFGSNLIQQRAAEVNAPHQFYSYTRGHLLHYGFTPPQLHQDIVDRTSAFLYDLCMNRSSSIQIEGPKVVELTNEARTYSISDRTKKYEWSAKGGTIVSQNGNSISVLWDKEGEQRLTAVPAHIGLKNGAGISTPILVHKNMNGLQITASPNPSTTFVNFDLKRNVDTETSVFIYDQQGKFIQKNDIEMTKGQLTLPVQHLKTGVYFVRLAFNGEMIHQTFMKK